MPVFASRVSASSPEFLQHRRDMLELVAQLRAIEGRTVALSEQRRARFEERGQLGPRERLTRLLDPGMPFLELYSLVNFLVDDPNWETSVPGATQITGIGFINGVRCMVMVDDSGINAGAMVTMSGFKAVETLDFCIRLRLPFVHLVESAGANLMTYRVEMWAKGGGMFRRMAKASAAGVPTFVVLHGPSTAGGAYTPGMSDYVVGIRKNGMAALAGAALTQAATGEIPDEQQLGGAEMHATTSGLVEYLAEDDAHGILICRDLVRRLDWNKNCPPLPRPFVPPPLYDPDELAGVVPIDHKRAYDVHEVITRLVDGSDIVDFKPRFGPGTVCAQAHIYGHAIGIIGNNGPIDPNGAAKATHFLQLCDQSETPLVFLNNTTGYMVGTATEQAGMIKHGAKMIQAVSNVRVPKITLYIGASYGAGNYGMCGHAYEPDFLFAWPNASTGVMGGEQAAITMGIVARGAAKRRGIEPTPAMEAQLAKQKQAILEHFAPQSNAFYTSGRMLDHGVIDPRDTRKILGFALETCWEARHRRTQPNTFGVARI
jgi:geranyl-CoA carboxylase beta subunit